MAAKTEIFFELVIVANPIFVVASHRPKKQ